MSAATPIHPRAGVLTLELPRASIERMAARFPEGVNVLIVPPSEVQPEFLRLPKAGEKCPVTGLPRTSLIELLQRAGTKVPVRHLRNKGAATGIALIPRQALIDYIHSLPAPEWQEENEED